MRFENLSFVIGLRVILVIILSTAIGIGNAQAGYSSDHSDSEAKSPLLKRMRPQDGAQELYKRGCLLTMQGNYDEARKFYHNALQQGASKGNDWKARVLSGIAVTYAKSKDHDTALNYFDKAEGLNPIEKKTAIAEEINTCGTEEGLPEHYALQFFTKAADLGSMLALYNLGCLHCNKQSEDDQNLQKLYVALKWFKKAETKGHPDATKMVGETYFRIGNSFYKDKDYPNARINLIKAAKRNCPQAQYLLGGMYFNGEGGAEDLTEALKWSRKARKNYPQAKEGVFKSLFRLGEIHLDKGHTAAALIRFKEIVENIHSDDFEGAKELLSWAQGYIHKIKEKIYLLRHTLKADIENKEATL